MGNYVSLEWTCNDPQHLRILIYPLGEERIGRREERYSKLATRSDNRARGDTQKVNITKKIIVTSEIIPIGMVLKKYYAQNYPLGAREFSLGEASQQRNSLVTWIISATTETLNFNVFLWKPLFSFFYNLFCTVLILVLYSCLKKQNKYR